MTRTKFTSPIEKLKHFLAEDPAAIKKFLEGLCSREQPLLLRTEIGDIFNEVIREEEVYPEVIPLRRRIKQFIKRLAGKTGEERKIKTLVFSKQA